MIKTRIVRAVWDKRETNRSQGQGQTKPTKVALGYKLAQSPALAKARA